jgi:hypothetical protein
MHIGLDLDGTITRCPEFFSVVSKALIAAGHKVYVVTWREDREFTLEDLAEHQITFDQLIMPKQEEIRGVPPHEWNAAASRWKAQVCRSMGIDILFEDMPEVANALDRRTAMFLAVDHTFGKLAYVKEQPG